MADTALDQSNTNALLGQVEAYCVFTGKDVSHVLNGEEFEQVIEGERNLEGLSGKIRMAYVVANRHQLIQSIVLFFIPLDEAGHCLDGWRLPLDRLSDTAGRGPNMGAGRIRLSCFSQCSISWHKDSLWDPVTSTFSLLKKSIQDQFSHLLPVESDPKSQEPSTPLDQEINILRRELRNETAAYRNQLQSLQQEVERQRLLNERLSAPATDSTVRSEDRVDLQVLRRQNEQLTMKIRELELSNEKYRNQYVEQPQTQDTDQLLEKMAEHEVMSVVYHPGAGHINLTPHQLQDYLEDPVAYAAHHVGLSKMHYKTWLKHQTKPKCVVCDAAIDCIGDPKIFDAEQDIYCERHKPE
jgi:hypothetical protein